MSAVSIPSSVGSTTVFSVSGTHTVAYAELLQTLLLNAAQATGPGGGGDSTVGDLNPSVATNTDGTLSLGAPLTGYVNEAVFSPDGTTNAGLTLTVPPGWNFLFDNVNGPSSVIDESTGGYIMVAGGTDASATVASAGDNLIVFAEGNNLYQGAMSAGGDLVIAGSGDDTLDTGANATSIFGGSGDAMIVLNDTAGGSGSAAPTSANDIVVLEDGHSTVSADGASDAVLALSAGQTIEGGISTADFTSRVSVLLAGGDGMVAGNSGDVGAVATSSGNTVLSGSGSLWFVASADSTGGATANTVEGTNGGTIILYGAASTSITYSDDGSITNGHAWFVAGTGNETLNAAQATDGMVLFGAAADTAAGGFDSTSFNDTIVGGAGNDTFLTGIGNETLSGGGGANTFLINETGTANHVLITDFGASAGNVVGFLGYSEAEVSAALNTASTVQTNYGTGTEITFGDGTSVTFVGIASLTGHVS